MNDPQPEGHMASYIRRRKFLATLVGGAATAWPLAARAQQTGKTHTIGLLSPASRSPSLLPALFDAPLAELGWIEGKNLVVERRYAENRPERLPELAIAVASWTQRRCGSRRTHVARRAPWRS